MSAKRTPGRWLQGMAGVAVLSVALGAPACTSKPKRSNTGWSGTWGRTSELIGARSTLSIVERGERVLVRWKYDTNDRKWTVRCGWDGVCEERIEGKRTAEILFEVTRKPGDDFLTVSVTRKPVAQTEPGYNYVDDLLLEPGGLQMTSYTRVLNGKSYPREATQVKRFDKVADGVADPPAEGGS